MAKYMTAQRRMLISFLKEHPDHPFSAREIADNLQDERISISAVYRNLSDLEEDGQIASVRREGTRDKFYRCLLSEECQSCIHLTCTKCGKTFHMNRLETQELIENAGKTDNFYIDAGKSVLYGVCSHCI